MKLIFIILLLPLIVFSQPENKYGRSYSNKLPDRFKINVSELRSQIYSTLPSYYKKGKYERMTYRFADYQANHVSDLVSSGEVYSDWPEFEKYLNEILKKVIPAELKGDSIIHAYIIKDGFYNAFMTGSGHTFLNVGFFGYVHDEATIAAVMAHELAHYYKQHSLKGFVKRETGKHEGGFFRNGDRRKKIFSISNELESDSLAMEWLQASGYHISGLLNSFRTMERLEKQQIRRYKYLNKIESSTHPLSEDRLKHFKGFFEKFKDEPGELFLISKEKFILFKNQVKVETLKSLLYEFNYSSCIETAFKFHITDPDNHIYLYYLMEGIRRKCYLDTEEWGKNFYTSRYYVKLPEAKKYDKDRVSAKDKFKSHLFEKFDLEIMGFGPKDINQIKAKFYWSGEPRFKTNEQAFDFFSRLGEAINCNECTFSNALSQTNNDSLRNVLLTKYLAFEKIQYRSFSQDLLSGTVQSKLSCKKLLLYNDLDGYIRQGQEDIPIRFQNVEDTIALTNLFDSVITSFPNRTAMYLTNLKNNKLNDFVLFKKLEYFSFYRTYAKGDRTKLHILDPRYYTMFNKYDVNEIGFVNCLYGEYRTYEKKLEEYIKTMQMDYTTLLSQTKRTRFFEVFVSSVRDAENSVMKSRYYGGEVKLKFKDPGFKQLVFEIRNKIHLNDKEVKKKNASYK